MSEIPANPSHAALHNGSGARFGPSGVQFRGRALASDSDLTSPAGSIGFDPSEADGGFDAPDRVEISDRARESARLSRLFDPAEPSTPRFDRVAAARKALDEGELDSPAKLQIAVERMIRGL